VGVRLTPLVNGTAGPALVRADVRVLWLRNLGTNPASNQTFCSASGADPIADNPPSATYHSLYVTTALKGNPSQ
jgi:hypothetical protein